MLPNYMQIWGLAKNLGSHPQDLRPGREDRLGARPRRIEEGGDDKDEADRGLQSEQSDGLHPQGRGDGSDHRNRPRGRGLDPGRRSVRRSRARGRRADAVVLREVRQGPGRRQPEQSLRPSGASDRLGRRPGRRHRRALGEARIPDPERDHALQPPGRVRPLPRRPAPPHPARPRLHPPGLPRPGEMDGRTRGRSSAPLRPRRRRSPSSSTVWTSLPRDSPNGCARRKGCSSCPASISAWTISSASATACLTNT